MMNNPMQMIMQMVQGTGNPMQAIMSMSQQNPQMRQAMQMLNGQTPAQMEQTVRQMAQQRGVDVNQIMRQLGLRPRR